MPKVLRASEVTPHAYSDEEGSDTYDDADTGKADRVSEPEDLVDDLRYDVYNLTAVNSHAIRFLSEDTLQKEQILFAETHRATQLLINKLFECPIEKTDEGPVAILPKESTRMPREKRIPEVKEETKWEKFAKEKGIKKQKKERMVWDEVRQEFAPRWGYKRADGGVEDLAVIEIKPGQDPYADPYAEARKEKTANRTKNLSQQIRNSGGIKNKKQIKTMNEFASSSAPGIPVEYQGEKRGKEGVRSALQLAQQSTASMGRFDEMRDGEPLRKLKGKKRSFKDNLQTGSDKETMKAQLRIVADKLSKKERGVTNSLAPYEGIIPDAPSDTFRKRKGKGKSASDDSVLGPKKKKGKKS